MVCAACGFRLGGKLRQELFDIIQASPDCRRIFPIEAAADCKVIGFNNGHFFHIGGETPDILLRHVGFHLTAQQYIVSYNHAHIIDGHCQVVQIFIPYISFRFIAQPQPGKESIKGLPGNLGKGKGRAIGIHASGFAAIAGAASGIQAHMLYDAAEIPETGMDGMVNDQGASQFPVQG